MIQIDDPPPRIQVVELVELSDSSSDSSDSQSDDDDVLVLNTISTVRFASLSCKINIYCTISRRRGANLLFNLYLLKRFC